MSEGAAEFQRKYIENIYLRQQLVRRGVIDCIDSQGNPLGELTEVEMEAVREFLALVDACAPAPIRGALRLNARVRKHVLLYAGLMALIAEDAKRTGRQIVSIAADDKIADRAFVESQVLSPLIRGIKIDFKTWDYLLADPRFKTREQDLGAFWIIGDLDEQAPAPPQETAERRRAAIARVLGDGACPVLMLHQEDRTPVVPFPPTFSRTPAAGAAKVRSTSGAAAAKGGCFIATAACGSPYAEEVNLLRGFRDEVLAPRRAGRAAMAVYERCSPPLARWITHRPAMRMAVRNLLIRPLARMIGGKPGRPE